MIPIAASKKRSKYGNIKIIIDGITFDSKAEGKRYNALKLLATVGKISDLQVQPKFPVEINGVNVFTYRGDFAYVEAGRRIVEDVKGMKTAMYRLKKKCVEAYYGIKIVEITGKKR